MSSFLSILGAIENGLSVVKLNLPHINVISYPSREPYAIFLQKIEFFKSWSKPKVCHIYLGTTLYTVVFWRF